MPPIGTVQRVIRLLLAVAGVAVITFVTSRAITVNATTAGFAFLLYVLVVASTWGFLEAAVSSIVATLAFKPKRPRRSGLTSGCAAKDPR